MKKWVVDVSLYSDARQCAEHMEKSLNKGWKLIGAPMIVPNSKGERHWMQFYALRTEK